MRTASSSKGVNIHGMYELFLESIGGGVVVTDKEGRITFMNRGAERMFGWTAPEVTGKYFWDVWSMEDEKLRKILPEESPALLALRDGKQVINTSYRYYNRFTKKFPVATTASPLISEDGSILGVIIHLRDITAEKEMEQVKNEFISFASHQLRTPLTAVKLYLEMFESGSVPATPEQQEIIKSMSMANSKMITLVDTFLNVSRMERGKLIIKRHLVNLVELVDKVVADTGSIASLKGCSIVFEGTKEARHIYTDSNLLYQVFFNVINNAVQYSRRNSKPVEVSIERKGPSYVIIVRDYGIGIPESSRSRIFERFFRASNALKAKTSGTGLGLYMCKVIMESLGGKIWLESQEDKGTIFYISVPLRTRAE